MKKDRLFLFFIIGFFFFALLFLCIRYPLTLWDENAYLGNARALISGSNYTEDFRFPLLEYIIAGIWLLTGESIFIARLMIIFFSVGSALLLYKISKRFLHNPLVPVIFFVSNSLVLFWSFRVYADMLGVFFTLLSFYLFLVKKPAASGVSASFAFLARFPNALFGIALGMAFLLDKKVKDALKFSAAATFSIVPWLVYNTIKYKNPLYDLIDLASKISVYTSSEPSFIQVKNLFLVVNFFMLAVILGIYAFRKEKKLSAIGIFTLFFIVYYFFFVNLKLDRYYLILLPFIYLAGAKGLESFFKNKKKREMFFMIFFLIHIVISFNMLYGKLQVDRCNIDGVMQQSIDFLRIQGTEGKTIISNSWPWFGYYLNSRISSTWTTDIDMLLDSLGPSYFVIFEKGGLEFDRSIFDNSTRIRYLAEVHDSCSNQAFIYSGE